MNITYRIKDNEKADVIENYLIQFIFLKFYTLISLLGINYLHKMFTAPLRGGRTFRNDKINMAGFSQLITIDVPCLKCIL